jgi:ABC-type nitrate/sulfonate/bicarbonate transport system substrate-binding protein
MLSRREFLVKCGVGALGTTALSLGGAGVLDALGSVREPDTAKIPVALQLSWVKDAEFSGFYVADKRGLFAKQGIKTTMTAGGPNVTAEQVIASGRAMIGLDSTDFITQARHQGAPLVAIGACFQKNPLGIMSLKKKNITSPHDLIGKKLGIPNGEQQQVTTFLKLNKVDPSKVHFVPYGTDPTPIANGSIDAALAFVTTDPYLLQSKGYETNSFILADFGYNVFNDCPFVTESTLKNHRSTLVKFMRAAIQGWEYNIAHPKYVVPLILDNYGKDLGFTYNSQYFQNAAQIPLMQDAATKAHGIFSMSEANIEVNMKTITEAGIKADRKVFDTSILEEVYAGANHI